MFCEGSRRLTMSSQSGLVSLPLRYGPVYGSASRPQEAVTDPVLKVKPWICSPNTTLTFHGGTNGMRIHRS